MFKQSGEKASFRDLVSVLNFFTVEKLHLRTTHKVESSNIAANSPRGKCKKPL